MNSLSETDLVKKKLRIFFFDKLYSSVPPSQHSEVEECVISNSLFRLSKSKNQICIQFSKTWSGQN